MKLREIVDKLGSNFIGFVFHRIFDPVRIQNLEGGGSLQIIFVEHEGDEFFALFASFAPDRP